MLYDVKICSFANEKDIGYQRTTDVTYILVGMFYHVTIRSFANEKDTDYQRTVNVTYTI